MQSREPFRSGDRVVNRVTGRAGTVVDVHRARTSVSGWRVQVALDHGTRSAADAAVFRAIRAAGRSQDTAA